MNEVIITLGVKVANTDSVQLTDELTKEDTSIKWRVLNEYECIANIGDFDYDLLRKRANKFTRIISCRRTKEG